MHESVYEFGRRVVAEHSLNELGNTVVEIGSWNVNGSLRDFFSNVNYMGYDKHEGPGVDKTITHITDILDDYKDTEVDVIVCTEVLEHDTTFWVTMDVIRQLLKKDGYLILSARGVDTSTNMAMFTHSPESGDFWRFMPQAWDILMSLANCEMVEVHDDKQFPGFYSLGKKL